MSRELKFRAWDTVSKHYVLGNEVLLINPYNFETYGNKYIWEQYTGLKDKNGKEIYEGDIVSEEFEYGGEKTKTIWQVRWCDDECAFELHYVSGFEVDDCSLVADDEEDYEVIGNIHENPDLLEQGNAKD